MIQELDLNLLRVFEMLLEEESVTRAAIRLDVSQAAVSASLNRLRKSYSDVLFYRSGKGMVPTTKALALAPDVRRAMDAIRATLDQGKRQSRHVIIGMSDDIEIAFGSKLIARFQRDLPAITPVFRQSHSGIASQLLKERGLDFALGSGGLMAPGLHRVLLGTSHYLSLTHEASEMEEIDLDLFCSLPHLLVSAGGLTGIVDVALASLGRTRQVAASTTHFSAIPFLLTREMIATIPAHAANAIAQCCKMRVIAPPLDLGTYPIELSARSTDLRDPLMSKCMELVQRTISSANKS